MKAVYGYTDCENVGSANRRDVRYIGYTTKSKFIEVVTRTMGNPRGGAYWIRPRMSITGNEDEVRIAHEHERHIIKIGNRTKVIIATYPLD